MKRVVERTLPNGRVGQVYPFHVCIKGLEKAILFKDDEDYDSMVKVLCVSARRKNVIVIIYDVASNHAHVAILAKSQSDADAYACDIKKVYSMWYNRKYGQTGILHRVEVKALLLDSDWYVRNALAYIPRNALDNGCQINEYRWSGYRAMFANSSTKKTGRSVAFLSKRERVAIMHTGDNLTDVPWRLEDDNTLDPCSFCDHEYLEQAFNHDQAFFLKTIGGQNAQEMKYVLEEKPYVMLSDNDFFKVADEVCNRWFKCSIDNLSPDKKVRVVPYLYHCNKTTIPQLARIIGLPREQISRIITKPSQKS